MYLGVLSPVVMLDFLLLFTLLSRDDFKMVVIFAVFGPISPTNRIIDGKQLTFCKGMLGCFGFWFHAENLPSFKNQNFEEHFVILSWIFQFF